MHFRHCSDYFPVTARVPVRKFSPAHLFETQLEHDALERRLLRVLPHAKLRNLCPERHNFGLRLRRTPLRGCHRGLVARRVRRQPRHLCGVLAVQKVPRVHCRLEIVTHTRTVRRRRLQMPAHRCELFYTAYQLVDVLSVLPPQHGGVRD